MVKAHLISFFNYLRKLKTLDGNAFDIAEETSKIHRKVKVDSTRVITFRDVELYFTSM